MIVHTIILMWSASDSNVKSLWPFSDLHSQENMWSLMQYFVFMQVNVAVSMAVQVQTDKIMTSSINAVCCNVHKYCCGTIYFGGNQL